MQAGEVNYAGLVYTGIMKTASFPDHPLGLRPPYIAMTAYLDMCARFHKYSMQNLWLILMACPHAKYVAGYKRWREMGRYVCKGERGIPILAPVIVKVDENDGEKRKMVGFKVVYVYGVS